MRQDPERHDRASHVDFVMAHMTDPDIERGEVERSGGVANLRRGRRRRHPRPIPIPAESRASQHDLGRLRAEDAVLAADAAKD